MEIMEDIPIKPSDPPSCILLLGEGNFSFSASLARVLRISSSSRSEEVIIIATDFTQDYLKVQQKDAKVVQREEKSIDEITGNIDEIRGYGGLVFLDVDATNLSSHPEISKRKESIRKIVFNFPHVNSKKMRMDLNRKLLEDFFTSAKRLLKTRSSEDVEVCVTMCPGQSGVAEVDGNKARPFRDSWQLLEMAARGDFVLNRALTFPGFFSELSKEEGSSNDVQPSSYRSCGYRSQRKSFRFDDAHTFIFILRDGPVLTIPVPNGESATEAYENKAVLMKQSLWKAEMRNWTRKVNHPFYGLKSIDLTVDCKSCDLTKAFGWNEAVKIFNGESRVFCAQDSRLLFSNFAEGSSDGDGGIRTGSLYPREHSFDISFFCQGSQKINAITAFRKCSLVVYGPLLRSALLLEEYTPDPDGPSISLTFRVVIQSVDRPLSSKRAHEYFLEFKKYLQCFGLIVR